MCSLLTAAVNRCVTVKNTTEAIRVYSNREDEGLKTADMQEDEIDEVCRMPLIDAS